MPPASPIAVDALRRLDGLSLKHLPQVLRFAERGDWRARAWSLSAAARLAAGESFVHGFAGAVLRRIGLRTLIPTAGYRKRFVIGRLVNALVDRSWPVRLAAAAGLGELRVDPVPGPLELLLRAPLRAERIVAAAAIARVRQGGQTRVVAELTGAESLPERIGDHTGSESFLAELVAAHPSVFADLPGVSSPAEWAKHLAGTPAPPTSGGIAAEIERYDAETDTEYLDAKPFSPINRRQNIRLLHTFSVLADQLHLPPEARVLDMGSGSAWVSELLARLGFRPVTLDISTNLLTVGRRRFSRAGLAMRFVAGDMTQLPIATDSVDAVLVMDALHHVPDVAAAFRETFRVLTSGGLFVLAEPGEGHSETEKSRAEMLEHGVHEREIHIGDAVEYGRAAGFDAIRVIPHHVPGISMTPEDLDRARESPADEWLVSQDGTQTYLAPFLLQSIFDHPVLVFQKGQRPIDSLMPRTLRAEFSVDLRREGPRVHGRVSLRNAGDTIWRAGAAAVGDVQLGLQLLSADRRLLNRDFQRFPLGHPVAPGRQTEVSVDLMLPDATTPFVLKVDLVAERICWFEEAGTRPEYVAL